MRNWPKTLADFPLFRDLGSGELEEIEAACRWRLFEVDETLLGYQDPSQDVYFVTRGSVRVLIHSPWGKEVFLREIGPGEFLGELAAIDGRPRSASIVASSQGLVARMGPQAFRDAIHKHPDVCDQILGLLVSEVRRLAQRVNEQNTLSVLERLIAELLRLARQSPDFPNVGIVSPPPRHQDLAARISSHRERITKDLRHLETIGLLQRDQRRFVLTDLSALEARLNGAR